jgi:hypothetical protein
MRVLPEFTSPATERLDRTHVPPEGAYPTYRDCLRWEFGFTCAFCLLHEADLVAYGADGTGLFAVEHAELRSARPDLEDDYGNCFFVCRFCNGARGKRPRTDADGNRLLDPCTDAWGDHFEVRRDRLRAVRGDADARYTHEAYDLDDERKVRRRRNRRGHLLAIRRTLRAQHKIDALLKLAQNASLKDRRVLTSAARELNLNLGQAKEDILRFRAIPEDAPSGCRCGTGVTHQLPAWLLAQTDDVPSPRA